MLKIWHRHHKEEHLFAQTGNFLNEWAGNNENIAKRSADLRSFAEKHKCRDIDLDASNFQKEIIKMKSKQSYHLIPWYFAIKFL